MPAFEILAAEVLGQGHAIRFRANGSSMRPFLRDGDSLEIQPPRAGAFRCGEILLYRQSGGRLLVHRVARVRPGQLLMQGDALRAPDGWIGLDQVLGIAVARYRRGKRRDLTAPGWRGAGRLWALLGPLRLWLLALWGARRKLFHLLLFITLLAAPGLWGQAAAGAVPPPFQVRSSDDQGLVVELNLPPVQTRPGLAGGAPCQFIDLPGWGQLGEAGQPAVPFKGELIALPPLGEAHLEVLEIGPEVTVPALTLCPVAERLAPPDPLADFADAGERLAPDAAAYQDLTARPGEWAALGPPTFLRSQRVAQLRLQPFQYQAGLRRLRYATHLVVRVRFDPQPAAAGRDGLEGPAEALLKSSLLNYAAGRSWRVERNQMATDLAPVANPDPAVQLAVSRDGLYRVTAAELGAQGVPIAGLDPRGLRLLRAGVEVAILVRGAADGVFDPGDEVLFFGEKNTGRYSDTTIYWLTWGGAPGRRVAELPGTPVTAPVAGTFLRTARAEVNLTYRSHYPSGPDQDRWYWDLLLASSTTVAKDFNIDLPHVAQGLLPSATARVRGLLRGFSAQPQHHTRIYLNGSLIQDRTWPAQAELSFDVVVPHAILLEGANVIQVESLLDGGISLDYTLVNWFEVDYQSTYAAVQGLARFSGDQTGAWSYRVPGFSTPAAELWEINDPLAPRRILNPAFETSADGYTMVFQQDSLTPPAYLAAEPGRLLAPDAVTAVPFAGLRSAANGADYLLITPPDFLAAVQPLAAYHAARGLRVRVVNTRDIYNEFGAGTLDPAAIRAFLAYAYQNWARPAPVFVLLVGDGHYDFKDYKGTHEVNYLPPYLADVDPWMGEVPADNLYVTWDAQGLPAMALGRLPVRTAAEASGVVQKILDYPQNLSRSWNTRTLLVADIPDDAGDFAADADAFGAQLPARWRVDKIYLPPGSGFSGPAVTAARQSILDGVNAGRLIVHYTGHSSAFFWSGSNLFGKQSIPALNNLQRLPFVMSMTCYVGYYATPSPAGSDYSGMDEALVRAAAGGAIATWSPTGEGTTAGHVLLDNGFIQAFFTEHLSEIGLSTTRARVYLYANSLNHRELIDTYLLLGDPALRLPQGLEVFLPAIQR